MSIEVMILMVIYPIGFLLTLTFFKFFGERVGMGGYDNQTDRWPDDWESNNEAFFGFSLAWFMVMPVLILFGIFKLLFLFSKWFLELGKNEPKGEGLGSESKGKFFDSSVPDSVDELINR